MTDLLDTIHDLQREVKALKALGDTSSAVAASIFTGYNTYPGNQIQGDNISNSVNWSKIPGLQTYTQNVRTAGNTAMMVEISGHGYTYAMGNVTIAVAIMWTFKHDNTVIYNATYLGSDGNNIQPDTAAVSTNGGGWYSYMSGNTRKYVLIGSGAASTMYTLRFINNLQPHTTYTVEAFPAYGIHVSSGEVHNSYEAFVNSLQVKVTNVLS